MSSGNPTTMDVAPDCIVSPGLHPGLSVYYIHNNSVKTGNVWLTEDYDFSSALNYQGNETLLNIEFI